jgi:hypothetical protein
VVDEYQEKALSRAKEASQTIAVLALQLDRIAADLESALTDLRASTRAKEPAPLPLQPTEPSAVDAPAVVGQLERRSGVDRRASQERRQVELGGLAARILGATNRRSGGDRRSGTGRRAEDRLPIVG